MLARASTAAALCGALLLCVAGTANADSFYIDSETSRPASVDATRFYALVSEVAWRWDVGSTTRASTKPDI